MNEWEIFKSEAMAKKENLRDTIQRLKEQKAAISKDLELAYKECKHEFANGYTLESVTYCTICDKEATELFPNMDYKHIEKLVQ